MSCREPQAAGCTALVADIERRAHEHNLSRLHRRSSLTAEPFFLALGYESVERGESTIAAGVTMKAVTMRKALTQADVPITHGRGQYLVAVFLPPLPRLLAVAVGDP